ncbi:MAG TPA: type II secretion system F family protein [Myxococcales bacterium]|nr:type II secretion system F family protein [Myxococcales bacterium]
MLAGLCFLLVSAAVFLLALLTFGVLRRAFEQYQARYVARSLRDLSDMFLFLEPRQIVLLNAAAMALFAGLGLWAGGVLLGALAAALGFFAPALGVGIYRRRRLRRFEAQLAEALQQMATALKAGLAFHQAVEQVARDALPPLSQEFGLYLKEVKLGVPVDEALSAMAARVGSEDLELVAASTNLARQMGGNLAGMFETIAGTVRERFRLEGRIRALTSQGKLQGIIVAALPVFVAAFLDWYRPDLMQPLFRTAYGYALIGAIVLLETTGFVLIRRIVAIDV